MISANTRKPDPGDLDRRQRRRQIFRGDVRGAEKHRRGEDQRDAAERPVGARGQRRCGGLVLGQRQWSTVQPGGCGGWRGQGLNSGAEMIESGEAAKNDKWPDIDKARKQEADMRDCARQTRRTVIAASGNSSLTGRCATASAGRAASARAETPCRARRFRLRPASACRPRRCRRRVPRVEAFGIANTDGSRVRKPARPGAAMRHALPRSSAAPVPALLRGDGKSLWPNGE